MARMIIAVMKPGETEVDLDAVIALAHAAGAAIMAVYGRGFSSSEAKDDGSPITEADLAAHHIIVDGLNALTPGIPVISEESPVPPYAERQHWPQHWLVDPLDGTREFIKRNGEFTVNIALIRHGKPVLGVVHAPALGQTYAGTAGGQALLLEAEWRQVITVRKLPARPRYFISRHHREIQLSAFLARGAPHEGVAMGSSLKFCRIAAGEADCYPRFGPINEWDTAAGQCVLEAAGGAVLALPSFTPMHYNANENLELPDFFAVGDTSANWQAIFSGGR